MRVSSQLNVNSECLRCYILLVIIRNCCASRIFLTNSPIIIIERQNLHTCVIYSAINLETAIQFLRQNVLRELSPCSHIGDRIAEVECLIILRIVVDSKVQRSIVDVDKDITIKQHISLLVLNHDTHQRLAVN